MDLKGTLVDTNLKIFPSETLLALIENIPTNYNVPSSIAQFRKIQNKSELEDTKECKPPSTQLTNKDLEDLSTIKKIVKKNEAEKPPAEEPCNGRQSESKTEDEDVESVSSDHSENEDTKSAEEVEKPREGPFLNTSDIDWLFTYLQKRRKAGEKNIPYLHEVLEGAYIESPQNKIIKRNPVLEARCVKLRAQQEAREYRKMTKSVDNVRMKFPEDTISYQLKQVNRQLIAIGQFIISIFAGFLFGFKGLEWMIGDLDFGFRLLMGVMIALIIALAEIYFLAKKLNEELLISETVQIGGPPKFADPKFNNTVIRDVPVNKVVKDVPDKEHQD